MAKKNTIAFTDKTLRNLKPLKDKDYEMGDAGCPGLRLRVSPNGRKVFRWYYQESDGKRRVTTLGVYDDTTLSKARQELEKLKEQHKEAMEHGGSHVSESEIITVTDLAEAFYKRRILPHRKRPDVVRSILDRDIIPTIGMRKLRNLNTPTIRMAVERVVDRGATTHAGKVLAIIKQMFRFGVSRGDMDSNPAESLDPLALGVVSNVKTRVLDANDLKSLWAALDEAPRMSDQVKAAIRILALTGVRSGELLKARWENVDFTSRTWVVPVSDQKLSPVQAKKGKPWTVPLSSPVVALFQELKIYANGSPFVMASTESATGYYTDKSLGRAVRRLFELQTNRKDGNTRPLLDIDSFSPHDLRRTLRTHLGKLRVPPHIAERCLNHSLGRIVDTYDQGDYVDERRDALDLWAGHVLSLIGEAEKVVSLSMRLGAKQ